MLELVLNIDLLKKTDRNKYWRNIVNKTKYSIEILYNNLSWEDAVDLEIFLIELYGRRDLNEGNLVNLTNGGEGSLGRKMTKELKEKISLKNKNNKYRLGDKVSDDTKQKMSKSHTGKKLSKEHCLIISLIGKNNKGRVHTKETCDKISKNHYCCKKVIDTSTNIIYNSVKEASKALNINATTLRNYISGRRNNKTKIIYYKT